MKEPTYGAHYMAQIPPRLGSYGGTAKTKISVNLLPDLASQEGSKCPHFDLFAVAPVIDMQNGFCAPGGSYERF